MASFVPNHRKKIEHLEQRQEAFWRLVDGSASREELLAAALEVRDARIRAIHAKQNQLNPMREAAFQKLKAEIAALKSTTAEEMLAELLHSEKGKPSR